MSDSRRLVCHRTHLETMLVAVRWFLVHPELRNGAEDPGPREWEERAKIAERLLVDALQAEPPSGLAEIMVAIESIQATLQQGVCGYGAYD